MKQLTVTLIAIFAICQFALAQIDTINYIQTEVVKDADYWLKKSKTHRTVGWVVLGAGFTSGVIGIIAWPEGYLFKTMFGGGWAADVPTAEEERKANLSGGLITTGFLLAASSTIFFIISSKNKKKANLLMKQENVMFTPKLKSGLSLYQFGITIEL